MKKREKRNIECFLTRYAPSKATLYTSMYIRMHEIAYSYFAGKKLKIFGFINFTRVPYSFRLDEQRINISSHADHSRLK